MRTVTPLLSVSVGVVYSFARVIDLISGYDINFATKPLFLTTQHLLYHCLNLYFYIILIVPLF